MEMIQGTSKFAPQDFISNMPDNVITNILDRLPLQEAVRTGILSRNWRFRWIMLSQLVFDDDFLVYLSKKEGENSYGRIISRLLLHLKGVITKFVLHITQKTYPILDEEDINNWILFLSRNGIKDLTFVNYYEAPLKLPTHLFSCLELKHLKLYNCCFHSPPSLNGFPNLLSLKSRRVQYESGKFGEFFSRCPVLENLKMGFTYFACNVELLDIAKLTNLRILSLFLCNQQGNMNTSCGSIFELMGFLPKLQELRLKFGFFIRNGARKRSPTTFPCLKALKLSKIEMHDHVMLSFAFEIIRRCPNLQTLEITSADMCYNADDARKGSPTGTTLPCLKTFRLLEIDLGNGNMLSLAYEIIMSSPNLHTLEITDFDEERVISSFKLDYNTTGILQLRSVVFRGLEASENEVCLIKYLLACSPFLEKIDIHARSLSSDEKVAFSTKLLKLHRASPVAEINLY